MMRKIEAILFDKDGTLMDFQSSWGPWGAAMITPPLWGRPAKTGGTR